MDFPQNPKPHSRIFKSVGVYCKSIRIVIVFAAFIISFVINICVPYFLE